MTSEPKDGEIYETTITAARNGEAANGHVDETEQQKRISARDAEKADGANFRREEPVPVTHVDWDGPDDPDNPMNWPRFKRNWQVIIVALIQLLSNLASTMFAPGAAALASDFSVANDTVITLTISIYLLGFALGPMVFAPLSELYGRLPIYALTSGLFLVFILGSGFATNIGMFIAFRFLSGCAGAASQAMSGGTVADVIPREQRGKWMGLIVLGPLMGPSIGPVAGGFMSQNIGWRWVFRVLAIAVGVLLIPGVLYLRETYAPVILQRRARRRGIAVARSAEGEKASTKLARAIIRPLRLLLFSPIVFFLSLYVAFSFGLMFLLFTSFSSVFMDQYGFSTGIAGLSYLGLGVGFLGGVIVQGRMSDRMMKQRAAARGGEAKPEDRLPLMAYMAPCIPIGMFWYGWSVDKQTQWIVPIIGTVFVGAGFIFILMPVMLYLIDTFGAAAAASAIAANTVLRSIAGAFLPLAGPRMYQTLGLGWGNSLLGFLAIAFMPLPWIFVIYGERIRLSRKVDL